MSSYYTLIQSGNERFFTNSKRKITEIEGKEGVHFLEITQEKMRELILLSDDVLEIYMDDGYSIVGFSDSPMREIILAKIFHGIFEISPEIYNLTIYMKDFGSIRISHTAIGIRDDKASIFFRKYFFCGELEARA